MKKRICTLLLSILVLAALVVTASAAGQKSFATANSMVIEPERIPYTDGQTIKEALLASDHTFTQLEEQGYIGAVDDVAGNYVILYDGGGYSVNAPASSITAMRIGVTKVREEHYDAMLSLVRRMAEEGHIVGNHTWHHYNMSQIADLQSFTRELQSVADQYREATGEEMPPYYRPPQGVYSEENLKMAKSLGYRTLFWSLAYVDWNRDAQPTPEQAYEKLLPRIHPGAVVLLHSTSQTNARILDTLLTKWEEMGYTFDTLDELYA